MFYTHFQIEMMMNEIVNQTADILEKGGIILYPTDTIWGLGCDASMPEAVQRIFALKRRRDEQSLLVLADESMLEKYLTEVPETAWNSMRSATKPLTVIYPRSRGLAAGVEAGDGSVGIRIPRHEFCISLLRRLKRPLVSTSANVSGTPAPQSFDEISSEIINGVDFVTPRCCEGEMTGKASAIIKLEPSGALKVIRE
ncbi:MAG: threonylcarbamoyl-AMP synthase [Prevotellaceae bacterium]|jgi:L-threonylcarbamoyladenylate synthase|nr:threonylcarbamoyl-AMP synthase [Prevotellaceae bacterium]